MDDLNTKTKIFLDVFKYTKDDTLLKNMLEWTLAVGNYMNGQSVKGGAYGFKLEMLEKLNDVKSLDNK